MLVCRLNRDSARCLSCLPPPHTLSSESTAHSCGTCLISSVIKINEVLIAAVIYVNDCGSQDEDFLPLLQSEGGSGVLCVQEIASQHCSAFGDAVVIVLMVVIQGGAVLMLSSLIHRV